MPNTIKVQLNNGSHLLLRQSLEIPGIAKTPLEIYQDGELLCMVLVEPDLSWVLDEKKQAALSADARKEYMANDKAWSDTPIAVELTVKQLARIKAVLVKAPELSAIRQTKALFSLYKAFEVGAPDA